MNRVLAEQLQLLPEYLGQHVLLTVTALSLGIGLSIPLAVMVWRQPRLREPVLAVASAIQTIPGLALLALMVPLLGRIGFLPALLALVLYSVLPVLRNTVTGIAQVDSSLIEAGRALGMTHWQLLAKVQLPLALPVIIAGIRTAAVWVVGMATLSTPVGATSLGNYIFSGLQTQNYTAVLVGCVAAASLALALDWSIRRVEIAISQRRKLALGVSALLVAVIVGLPLANYALLGPSGPTAVVGTKTFTEQYILGNLLSRTLARAGFNVESRDSLGSAVAFNALAAGSIDAYVDYTGTIWANYMRRNDNPGRDAMLTEVRDWLLDEHDIEVAAALGFENAYALAMSAERAGQLGIESIADLTPFASRMTIGGDYEFFVRPEWAALTQQYSLPFIDQVSMDSTLMYSALAAGEVDVISAFSSDGRILEYNLVVLDDSLEVLPAYDAVVLAGPTRHSKPGLAESLAVLNGTIDSAAMQRANRYVDLVGGSITEAAESLDSPVPHDD